MSRFMRSLYGVLALLVLATGCATRLPASYYARVDTHALEDTSNTRLGRAYEQAAAKHPGLSGFHLLPTGPEALMMRIALIEASQRSIDMQYFSTHDDTTGKLLLEAVARAADRGVRVRMLLDDWNLDDFEAGAVSLDTHPNIEIRVFNPYSTRDESFFAHFGNVFSDIRQFTRRMHNKAIIFDNQIAIMGGRNLGDEYFDASPDINFQDIDVFASGPITRQISKNFDAYWNSEESFPISALNLPPPNAQTIERLNDEMKAHWQDMIKSPIGKQLNKIPLPREVKNGDVPLIWARAELAADSPGKIDLPSEDAISAPGIRIDALVNKAQREFIVFTPYFVPLDSGVEELTALVARGVAVRIVTNSLSSTDMVPAQAGYSHYREALVKGGVELYEIKSSQPKHALKSMFEPSSQNGLHAKIYMIDRKDLVLGSFNLDPRSAQLNTEQVLVIHSPELCAKIARLFEEATSPASSYRVMLANAVPIADRPDIQEGDLIWVTEENGKTVYYDFNPHAGFWRNVIDGIFSILPIDTEL
ncbi:MAG: phospholipase D family protein [Alphaproteobacteria bacterium]|nr:phospholipase D family protein [Alphaproteobacteria bacterium]